MSTTKHPILTAIQPLHLNETRCLKSAIKIQKDPEDTNAYFSTINEVVPETIFPKKLSCQNSGNELRHAARARRRVPVRRRLRRLARLST